jgi:hypothetical protein
MVYSHVNYRNVGTLFDRYQASLKAFALSQDTLFGMLDGIVSTWGAHPDVVIVILDMLVSSSIANCVRASVCDRGVIVLHPHLVPCVVSRPTLSRGCCKRRHRSCFSTGVGLPYSPCLMSLIVAILPRAHLWNKVCIASWQYRKPVTRVMRWIPFLLFLLQLRSLIRKATKQIQPVCKKVPQNRLVATLCWRLFRLWHGFGSATPICQRCRCSTSGSVCCGVD